jgi:hypothetical protein
LKGWLFQPFFLERGERMPKLKFLKSFVSAIGSFAEGDSQELEIDTYTLQNWVECGLIEEVKEKKTVKKDADK